VSKRCSDPNCFAHLGEQCRDGEPAHSTCRYWSVGGTGEEASSDASTEAFRVPWSGSALGLADLSALVPRGRSVLVGVLGAHDAGKTTLLTGAYLALHRKHRLGGAQFAGSRTLGAWEALAAWTRFDDAARQPSFPPHTPRGTSRVPGLLHLALRDQQGALRDVLLADAPGEWFSRWSLREDGEDAAGARWVVRHADTFIIVADCERLSGSERGQARSDTRKLIERLGNHVAARPAVFVWAKSDHKPPGPILEALKKALRYHIPHAVEVSTTTTEPTTLLDAMSMSVGPAWIPAAARAVSEPCVADGPFCTYRGTHEAQ
jgi:hypothetical protein